MPFSAIRDSRCVMVLCALTVVLLALHILLDPAKPSQKYEAKLGLQNPFTTRKLQPAKVPAAAKAEQKKATLKWVQAPAALEKLAAETEWTEVFADDFGRAELGANWIASGGDWKIVKGKLQLLAQGGNCILACKAMDFSGDMKLTYECRALRDEPQPTDLSAVFGMTENNRGTMSDVLFRFGSYDNTMSGIGVSEQDKIIMNNNVRIRTLELYKVTALRRGKYLLLEVNGLPVVSGYTEPAHVAQTFKDKMPKEFGFYVYRGLMEFDNVKVYMPAKTEPASK